MKAVKNLSLSLSFLILVIFGIASFFFVKKNRITPAQFAAAQKIEVEPVTAADIHALIPKLGAKFVIVNMWASWCMPCREEFPGFIRFYRENKAKGVELLFISNDFDSEIDQVKIFLAEQNVDFKTYLRAEKEETFMTGFDSRWTGALPTTFIYDGSGKLMEMVSGDLTYEDLQKRFRL